MIQTVTTGQLANAQRVVISKVRFTAEHSAPCISLVEKMTLGRGEKSITAPKVGQMSWQDLVDGVDMTDSEEIGMATTDLTTSEAGIKVILTDKLVRQENEDVFGMVGRQIGDGLGRKKDGDIVALFAALNGGTSLGAATKFLTLKNLAACISYAKSHKFSGGGPLALVHHPNAIFGVASTASIATAATAPIPSGFSQDLLKDFYKFVLNGVAVFEDGNIAEDADGDGIGAIFARGAMVYVESKGFTTERQRDASLRATEVVATTDYGVFELDDAYGAPLTYDVADLATNN